MPVILAALALYHKAILAELAAAPFRLDRYAARDSAWFAIMAIRAAMGDDFSPRKD